MAQDNYFARKRREREQRIQLTPPDPKLPHETKKAANEAAASVHDPAQSAANVRETNARTRRTEALLPHEIREKTAAANKAEREANLPTEAEIKAESERKRANTIRAITGEVKRLYEQDIKGQPRDRLWGATEYIDAIPTNDRFRQAGANILPLIRPLIAQSAKEGDSDREMLIFESYVPSNDDSDLAIEQKFKMLDLLIGGMVDGKPPSQTLAEMGDGAVIGPDGRADYSAMQGGGTQSPVDPGATFRTEPDAEASAFIDRLVKSNTPYTQAVRQFRKLYPWAPAFKPKDYNDALKHYKANRGFRGSYGGAVRNIPLSAREQSNNAASQSGIGAFAGNYLNATFAGLPAYAAGDQGTFWQETTRQQHPGLSFAGELGGGVTGTLSFGRALRPFMPATRPGLRHLTGDLGYGAAYGAAQNPENELGGAIMGAGAAGAGNAVGRYTIAPALRLGGDTASRIGQAFGGNRLTPEPLPPGQNMVLNRIGGDFDNVVGRLDEAASLNMPYALADADPRLRMLAGSATRKSPNVLNIAEQTIEPRNLGQAERAIGAIDTHLAPHGNLDTIAQEAIHRARAASGDLYREAFAQPPPDLTANPVLADILRRPTAEAGLRRAYNLALDEGVPPAELSITIGMDGKPILNANPTWKTLHYVRRGLDAEIDGAIDPVTRNVKPGMSDSQGAMIGLRKALDEQIRALNPQFKAADAEFARFAQQGSAARQGYSATAAGVTPTNVQTAVSGQTPETLPFYRQGFASSMADTVERGRFSGDPYNMIYGSPAQRQKLGTVFPEGAPTFGRIRDLETDMSKTQRELLGGSQTQPRAEADKLFESSGGMAGDMAFAAATGTPPPSMIRQFGAGLLDNIRLRGGQKKAEEIGPLLLNTDPAAVANSMRHIADLALARRLYEQQMRGIGGSIMAPLPLMLGNQ